ncbi:MIF4G domain-containing protein [Ditylenchus destructor]|uniref:MIF4G domain-containing protein n=1 Tax=Ditylenchus destructor TaxID=166010 RepID=A0AAD4N5X0_9BILA|nr:MIF4G domain-containing protein [Ditylenchus destructor]
MIHRVQHVQQFLVVPPPKRVLKITDPKTQSDVILEQTAVDNSKETETAAQNDVKSRAKQALREKVRMRIDGEDEQPSKPIDQNGQTTVSVQQTKESDDSQKDEMQQGGTEDKVEKSNAIAHLPSPYIRACPRCKLESNSPSSDTQVAYPGSEDDKVAPTTPLMTPDKSAPETMTNVENIALENKSEDGKGRKAYDKTTLLIVREFVEKNLTSSAFMCPSSQPVFSKAELNDNKNGNASKGNFTPSFRHNGSPKDERRNPQNMHSFRLANAFHTNKERTVMARSSMVVIKPTPIDEPVLKRTNNAWKPKRTDSVEESEDVKQEKIQRTIRGLLNKLTPSNYEELSQEMCKLRVYESENLLSETVNLVFEKAVEEPHFCSLYSDLLCLSLIKEASKSKQPEEEEKQESAESTKLEAPTNAPKLIHDSILRWCQREFESKEREREIQELEDELELDDSDDAKKQELKERLSIAKKKNKRRAKGINSLIAQLYRHGYVTDAVALQCALELVKFFGNSGEEEYMEFALHFLETIGPTYENNILKWQNLIKEKNAEAKAKAENCWRRIEPVEIPKMPVVFENISSIYDTVIKTRSQLSPRLQCLVMNLEDLRKNRWTSTLKVKGPKTLTDIRKETEAEIQQKEMERRKLDAKVTGYGGGRYQGNGSAYSNRSRDRPPQQYHGRSSASSGGSVNYPRGSVNSSAHRRRGSTDSGSSYNSPCNSRQAPIKASFVNHGKAFQKDRNLNIETQLVPTKILTFKDNKTKTANDPSSDPNWRDLPVTQ